MKSLEKQLASSNRSATSVNASAPTTSAKQTLGPFTSAKTVLDVEQAKSGQKKAVVEEYDKE